MNEDELLDKMNKGKGDITILMVLEPMEYDFKKFQIFYPKFGFCICSTDKVLFDDLSKTINASPLFNKMLVHIDLDEYTKDMRDMMDEDSSLNKFLKFINIFLLTLSCSGSYDSTHGNTFTLPITFSFGKRVVHYLYMGTEAKKPKDILKLMEQKRKHHIETGGVDTKSIHLIRTNPDGDVK